MVLNGLDTMLDNDFIGENFDSSPSSTLVLCFSGAPPLISSEKLLLLRLNPLLVACECVCDDVDVEGSLQLIIERLTACFKLAPFITFCFKEFCCDGDRVLSCNCK